MKPSEFITQPHVYLEIAQESLRVWNGATSMEMRLERSVNAKLSEACKTDVVTRLQTFLVRKSLQPRARIFCAIGARGVSLRRLSLPGSSKDDVRKLLPLQIEREFPLPPDQLAWGAQPMRDSKADAQSSNGKQDYLVIAVKKETLEEYSAVLNACGATPVFTLAALDRTYACPQPAGSYALLAVENTYSELITVESGVPMSVRVLPWGRDKLTGASREVGLLGVQKAETVSQYASFGGTVPGAGFAAAAEQLLHSVNGQSLTQILYVTGLAEVPGNASFTNELGTRLASRGVDCRQLELPEAEGPSAALLGLRRVVESHDAAAPLVLQVKQARGRTALPPREQLKWAGMAAGLFLLALLLPYAEALTLKSHLAHTLAAIKSDQSRLGVIDRELDFLQYLQANEPPYMDAMLVLAKSAPQGTHFDSITMNRRGEVSLRGALRDGQQVADLRTKLIASGFFASVAVEEQAPTPDRQKVNVRMTALWKPAGSRISPPAEPPGTNGPPQNVAVSFPAGPPGITPGMPSPLLSPSRVGSPKMP